MFGGGVKKSENGMGWVWSAGLARPSLFILVSCGHAGGMAGMGIDFLIRFDASSAAEYHLIGQ
jgi:hypothetical protein